MPLPHATEARLYYRAAINRFGDAEFLLAQGRTTGAVYLAGYGVECMLKALILSSVAAAQQAEVLDLFIGRRGHDFGWLRQQYHERCHATIPAELTRDLARVNTWSTDLRYQGRALRQVEASEFLNSAARVIRWAEARM